MAPQPDTDSGYFGNSILTGSILPCSHAVDTTSLVEQILIIFS